MFKAGIGGFTEGLLLEGLEGLQAYHVVKLSKVRFVCKGELTL